MRHGSCCQCERTIKFDLRVLDDYLSMEIEDEGKGFDWRSEMKGEHPDQTSECGRGLAIMRAYSTQIAFNEKGNKLILKKKVR